MSVNSKYLPLVSGDQRQSYKDDFNAEYDEYRLLHARVESVTRRFSQLDAQCRKLVPGTKEHQVAAVSPRPPSPASYGTFIHGGVFSLFYRRCKKKS